MHRLIRPTLCALIALGLALDAARPAPVAAGERQCFPETGYCADNAFYAFWLSHGSIAILGLPVGPAVQDDSGRIVQYYERVVMEWHPDRPLAFKVQLALLGAERLGGRPERETPPSPCAPANCRLIAETNHTIRDAFLSFWTEGGGTEVFGLPLTEEFAEVNAADGQSYPVQYFERSRFEWQPARGGVMLGLLGAEAWAARPALRDRPPIAVPDYPLPEVGLPARLTIPGLGVSAPVTPVGLEADGSMGVPNGPSDVAWLRYGSRPGEPGNAALAGHVDYRGYGPAIFWRLRELRLGDAVWVTDAAGVQRRFIVYEVRTYRTNDAPLERVFGATADTNLNLITCIGTFSSASGEYDQRLVVYTRWDGAWRS